MEIKPTQPVSESLLIASIRNAWIRLRFLAPHVAIRADVEPWSNGQEYFLEYQSPKAKPDVISKWVDETLIFHGEEKSLVERNIELKDNWWCPDGHWNVEMHVGRFNGNVQLM